MRTARRFAPTRLSEGDPKTRAAGGPEDAFSSNSDEEFSRWTTTAPPEAQPPKPRFLDRVRQAIHARNDSRSTQKAYVAWIRRFIVFHGKRHAAEMAKAEIAQFLTSLATQKDVSPSAQNQALAALLFL